MYSGFNNKPIQIIEKPTKKVVGDFSLWLDLSELDQEANNLAWQLTQLSGVYYHKKLKELEIPIYYLTRLKNLVQNKWESTLHRKVNILLINHKDEVAHSFKPEIEYPVTLYPYQTEGITYGLNHDKWILADDMGLGKTLQMIYLAEELKLQKGIEHCLVICCVASLRANWRKEIEKFSKEKCIVLGEKVTKSGKIAYATIKDRAKQLKEKIDEFFIITNIETIRSNEFIDAFRNSENKIDMIVADEVHLAANKNSLQGKNFLKLDAPYKVCLTGTLLTNSPLNSYVPLTWLGYNNATLSNFKSFYCVYGGFGGYQIMGYKHLDFLKETLSKCMLRRTKDLLDLPEKIQNNIYLSMEKDQTSLYEEVKSGILKNLDLTESRWNEEASLLALCTRLRQVTSYPGCVTSNNISSAKTEYCLKLIQDILQREEKIVVYSSFIAVVEKIKEELDKLSINSLIVSGDNANDISTAIDKFQNDNDYKVIVGTWQKLGTGVTLTTANNIIYIDTPWTNASKQQADDRIYRIGQKKTAFIYNLICENTIDERVLEIVETKKAISDYVIDNKRDNKTVELLKKYLLEN